MPHLVSFVIHFIGTLSSYTAQMEPNVLSFNITSLPGHTPSEITFKHLYTFCVFVSVAVEMDRFKVPANQLLSKRKEESFFFPF